jgi:hypothetical protein
LKHQFNQLVLAQPGKLIAIHRNRESRSGARRKGGWVITLTDLEPEIDAVTEILRIALDELIRLFVRANFFVFLFILIIFFADTYLLTNSYIKPDDRLI